MRQQGLLEHEFVATYFTNWVVGKTKLFKTKTSHTMYKSLFGHMWTVNVQLSQLIYPV